MENILGRKVRLIGGYKKYPITEGIITQVYEEKDGWSVGVIQVTTPDGNIYHPWGPNCDKGKYTPECELIEDEFVLPKKWAIKASSETVLIIGQYYDKMCKLNYYTSKWSQRDYVNSYWHSHNLVSGNSLNGNNPGSNYNRPTLQDGFTEITFEQFTKYVLNKPTMKEETRKIIGYKCPTDLFANQIKKDTLFVSTADVVDPEIYYPESNLYSLDFTNFPLPKEIVEQWQPVYEELFKVGDWVYCLRKDAKINPGEVFQVSKASYVYVNQKDLCIDVYIDKVSNGPYYESYFRKATQQEVAAFTNIKINGYVADFTTNKGSVKFGCKAITKTELEAIKLAFETFSRLEGKPNKAGMVNLDVEGTFTIDYTTICKLISNIK